MNGDEEVSDFFLFLILWLCFTQLSAVVVTDRRGNVTIHKHINRSHLSDSHLLRKGRIR